MGIRYLNRFLKDNASPSINLYNLAKLSGKKIAVDISIYIYRFAGDNTLIENIYLMLSIFRHYNIIPIFVFDGRAPVEKLELLQKRKEDKEKAKAHIKKRAMELDQEDMIPAEWSEDKTLLDDEAKDFLSSLMELEMLEIETGFDK